MTSTDTTPASTKAGKISIRLSAEREAELATQWRVKKSMAARDELVTANLGLVVAVARQYQQRGVPLDELVAEGNLGLINAVDRFDPACGARFSTYAAFWIKQGISRAFAASSPRGRLNGQDRRDLRAFELAERRLYSQTGQAPSHAELARELGWGVDRVAACAKAGSSFSRPVSLDQTQDERTSRRAGIGAPETAYKELAEASSASEMVELLSGLTDLERSALELRFGLHGGTPRSVSAVATCLDRTKQTAKLALRSAISKVARSSTALRRDESGDVRGSARGLAVAE